MKEQKVKEISFELKTDSETLSRGRTNYSKSELDVDRQPIDYSKYVNSYYEFKLKNKHVQYLTDYVKTIKKFYHEEFDVEDKLSYRHCELEIPSKEQHPKIYKIVSGIFNEINNKYFKYDLVDSVEIQIIKYNIGGNYNWHCDYGLSQNPNADRKLSLSIQLSDEFEYEGCDLILCDQSRVYRNLNRKIGCGIVFDSKTPHKVTHLTNGVRYCLVAWMHGPQLR
jgi:hypothetical protein